MIAFLQYLAALMISSYDVTAPGLPAGRPDWEAITLMIASYGLVWSTVGLLIGRRIDPRSERSFLRFLVLLDVGRVSALGAYWLIAQHGLGKEWPAQLGIADWVFVPHLVRLAPFVFLLALLRVSLHPVGVRLEVERPSPLSPVALEMKQALLPLGPLLPLLVVWDLVFLADPGSWLGAVREVVIRLPVAQALVSLMMLLAAILAMPFLLRLAWRAKPLPPSPLRTRLDAYAERVGLRGCEILVWPAGPGTLNAAMVGAVPHFRYVFVTDALLETLGPDEIEAVFAHEAGHARRGHVLMFFGFTTVLVLSSLLPDFVGQAGFSFWSEMDGLLRLMLMLGLWLGVVFGWVSRRFEQEADVFGLDTIPFEPSADGAPRDPAEHPFARALERIAVEAGGIREITGWRHPSIADRVAFVGAYLADAGVRARYRRSILLLRGTLIVVIAGFCVFAGMRLPQEVAAAPVIWEAAREPYAQVLPSLQAALAPLPPRPAPVRARALLSAAQAAKRAGRGETGLRWLRSAAALSPRDPLVLAAYARALGDAGKPRGAVLVWRDLVALDGVPDDLRKQAAAALANAAEPED